MQMDPRLARLRREENAPTFWNSLAPELKEESRGESVNMWIPRIQQPHNPQAHPTHDPPGVNQENFERCRTIIPCLLQDGQSQMWTEQNHQIYREPPSNIQQPRVPSVTEALQSNNTQNNLEYVPPHDGPASAEPPVPTPLSFQRPVRPPLPATQGGPQTAPSNGPALSFYDSVLQEIPVPWQGVVHQNWQEVWRVYGTALFIITKNLPPPSNNSSVIEGWLRSHNLPMRDTLEIFEIYTNTVYFRESAVTRARKKELKQILKRGVSSSNWPGEFYFSELRCAFERLRKKALEFLDRDETQPQFGARPQN